MSSSRSAGGLRGNKPGKSSKGERRRSVVVEVDRQKAGLSAKPSLTLESQVRLSHSLIWPLLRRYYEIKGPSSWKQTPNYVTSNCFIADRYAKLIYHHIVDLHAREELSPGAPVYVLELGAGSGKFSFLLLTALQKLLPRIRLATKGRKTPPLRYVMTDAAMSNVQSWQQHAKLKPFVDSGLLDMAVYDCEQPAAIQLVFGKMELTPSALKNPTISIANYVFDSLRHDGFQVRQHGGLREALLTTSSTRAYEPDLEDPALIQRLHHQWTHIPTSEADEHQSSYYHGYACSSVCRAELCCNVLNYYCCTMCMNTCAATYTQGLRVFQRGAVWHRARLQEPRLLLLNARGWAAVRAAAPAAHRRPADAASRR
jgi:hypothetical protein